MWFLQVMNVFQIKIQKNFDVPSIFANTFTYPSQRYPTNSRKTKPHCKSRYLLEVLHFATRFVKHWERTQRNFIYRKIEIKTFMDRSIFEWFSKTPSNESPSVINQSSYKQSLFLSKFLPTYVVERMHFNLN